MSTTLPHGVVIGGYFAGLWAVRDLAGAAVRITVGDLANHHLFQPLLSIGRRAAVVELGRWTFSGAPACWFWLWAHVFFLIGFRNRLVVLTNWSWAYWTYQCAARIILGSGRSD